jgi:hypothetical protein
VEPAWQASTSLRIRRGFVYIYIYININCNFNFIGAGGEVYCFWEFVLDLRLERLQTFVPPAKFAA